MSGKEKTAPDVVSIESGTGNRISGQANGYKGIYATGIHAGKE